MDAFYQQLIAGKQKAVAAFVAGFILTFLVQHGLNIGDMTVHELIKSLIVGGINYVGVYLKRNQL